MRREHPALHLAERAIRLRQRVQTPVAVPETSAVQPVVRSEARIASPVLVGASAGFLAALVSLGFNVVSGAWGIGIEKMELLRIFATMLEGRAALDPAHNGFFTAALALHLVAGMLFGVIFVIVMKKFCCTTLMEFTAGGTLFGIALWVVNFYAVLYWLQPLLFGERFIVNQIPLAVAVLTHVCYGVTLSLVTFSFQRDV